MKITRILIVASTMTSLFFSSSCSKPRENSTFSSESDAAEESAAENGRGDGLGTPDFGSGVRLRVLKVMDGAPVASFGVPIARGRVKKISSLRVLSGKDRQPIASAKLKELIPEYDKDGDKVGLRAFLVQIPAEDLGDGEIEIRWSGGNSTSGSKMVSFREASAPSKQAVSTADWAVKKTEGVAALVASNQSERVLFTGREPAFQVIFPEGYLADSGVLGEQVSAKRAHSPALRGISAFSDNLLPFAKASMYLGIPYAIASDAVTPSISLNPNDAPLADPSEAYEGWLYDRCATFLTAALHTGDESMRRTSFRACSFYGSAIELSGPREGIFKGKKEPEEGDPKYSHSRGLYAYYALTGDENAAAAIRAIAELWSKDENFVQSYANGSIRSEESIWTERLLATSLEGLYYGFRITGERKYREQFLGLLNTAYRHITGDKAELKKVNPSNNFPPQNCFIHNAQQAREGDSNEPWCSSWMSELMIDVLLRYQEDTGDSRIDEIFVRLSRFLRDTGSAYHLGDVQSDSFLKPRLCYKPDDNPRLLVPLYGAAIDANGKRQTSGEYDDFEHCPDATALVAAGMRALKRQGNFDQAVAIGPFKTEGESFMAMFHEFAACSMEVFKEHTRPHRNPSTWTTEEIAELGDNGIAENHIGWPIYNVGPQRKLGWWFNMSMLQFGLLADANLQVGELHPGAVQPAKCK